MIDVSDCETPGWLPWAITGGVAVVAFLGFVIIRHVTWRRNGYQDDYANSVGFFATVFILLPALVFTGFIAYGVSNNMAEQRKIDLLSETYGISQLECKYSQFTRTTSCAWVDSGGQPASGELVERGAMAGLVDFKQGALPIVKEQ